MLDHFSGQHPTLYDKYHNKNLVNNQVIDYIWLETAKKLGTDSWALMAGHTLNDVHLQTLHVGRERGCHNSLKRVYIFCAFFLTKNTC